MIQKLLFNLLNTCRYKIYKNQFHTIFKKKQNILMYVLHRYFRQRSIQMIRYRNHKQHKCHYCSCKDKQLFIDDLFFKVQSFHQNKSDTIIIIMIGQQEEHKTGRKRVKQQYANGNRDFYVMDKKIYIFTETKDYTNINMVLTDIAEPLSKPAHINEFQINRTSLLRAKALGYTYDRIAHFLSHHMVNPPISHSLNDLLRSVMDNKYIARLYLVQERDRNYYVFEYSGDLPFEFPYERLLSGPYQEPEKMGQIDLTQGLQTGTVTSSNRQGMGGRWIVREYQHNQLAKWLFQKQIPVLSEKLIEYNQIQQEMHRNVELYRSKNALHCKNLKIELKAFTKLREYQSEALKAVVQVSRKKERVAKSGYIVLPCGAGKTLLGIAICTKIKKETLIVCSSDSGADQWKREIQKWTQGLAHEQIVILTAKSIQDFKFSVKDTKGHIFISTYSNLKSKLQSREGEQKKQIKIEHEWMRLMPWGLIVFDEAQWLPAPGNSLIANSLQAHVKIGLTATPLREDQNIKSLIYMIGPQLYVGSWRKFVEMGYLANPKCIEVRTKLTRDFRTINDSLGERGTRDVKEREAIYQCNPNKIKTLMYLLEYHQKLDDQIIVFCDRISVINYLADRLKIPLLSGKTSTEDRNFVFDMFREGVYKTILLSRIGDEAIDLPNANVAIEINIHKGSRRQMLQRLGRIMRPKDASSSQSYNAIFYTIVTVDTLEMHYFSKRRECLVNLGFQYDLRFCEFGDSSIPDLMRDDGDKAMVKSIRERFQNVIANEVEYWNIMKNDRE